MDWIKTFKHKIKVYINKKIWLFIFKFIKNNAGSGFEVLPHRVYSFKWTHHFEDACK